MKFQLYAVHDQAVNLYMGPDPARTHGEAERKFRDNVNNPEAGLLFKHPEQFGLFHIGEFDPETGKITPNDAGPKHMLNGTQMKEENGSVSPIKGKAN